MNNLLKGELFKIKNSRVGKLLIFVPIIASILTFLYLFISTEANSKISNNTFTGIAIFYGLTSGILYETILSAILASSFVCSDFSNGTINLSLTYGYSRFKVLLSKLVVFLIANMFMNTLFIFITTTFCSVAYGFGEELSIYCIWLLIKNLFANCLGTITISTIIFFIAILCKHVIAVLVLPIFFFFIYALTTSFTDPVIPNLLPCNLVINAINNSCSFLDIIKILISCIVTSTICIYLSYIYIRKVDFK